jgi:hypothetical protein
VHTNIPSLSWRQKELRNSYSKLICYIEQLSQYSNQSKGCNTKEMFGKQEAQLFSLLYMPNDTIEWTSLVLFSGIKRPGCEICHSQPSRAEARHAQSYASDPSLFWWRVLNLAKKNYILVHQCTNLVNHEIQKIEGLTSESAFYRNRNLPLFWVNFNWELFTEKPIDNGQCECDSLESLLLIQADVIFSWIIPKPAPLLLFKFIHIDIPH